MAQLRRFYNEAVRIQEQIAVGRSFESVRSELLMLDSFAQAAVTKNKAPMLFKLFIEKNLEIAKKDKKSFENGFVQHFMCIVNYFPDAN